MVKKAMGMDKVLESMIERLGNLEKATLIDDYAKGKDTEIPKIRHFMRRNGSPEPAFKTDADRNYFLVTISPHPLAIQELAKQITEQIYRILTVLLTSPLSSRKAMEKLRLKHSPAFNADYLKPALNSLLIEMTQPKSPKSPTQKYRLPSKGLDLLKSLPSKEINKKYIRAL